MAAYSVMQSRIASELHRDDLTTQIQYAINDAANHYMRMRFWFNETSTTAVTVAGTATYSWPTRFIQLDSMTLTSGTTVYPLKQVSEREIDELYVSTSARGRPYCFAEYKQQFRLYPTPDAVYTLTYYYLISYVALSGDTDTNVWTTEAEELIRTRAKKLLALQGTTEQKEMIPLYDALEQDLLLGLQRQTTASTTAGKIKAWA